MEEDIKHKKLISLKEFRENYSGKTQEESGETTIEIRLDNESFNSYLEYKKDNWDGEDDSDNFLCNMIGEDLDFLATEDYFKLSKPLFYAYLMWNLYYGYCGGGLSYIILKPNEKFLQPTIEALNEIGLREQSEIIKKRNYPTIL